MTSPNLATRSAGQQDDWVWSGLSSNRENQIAPYPRFNSRFNLISHLLEYPHQTGNILQENEDLIDYALVQLLENMSEYMRRENHTNSADFLSDVTDYIKRYLSCQNDF